MKKQVVIITLVLGIIGVAWGIHINLKDKSAIGIIEGADDPTAIFVAKNTDVDIEEIEVEDAAREWTKQEIAELFKTKVDTDCTLIACTSMFDFAYDRVGVILYTDSKEGYIHVAFMDKDGNMQHCGVETELADSPEFTYLGNGEVAFRVCSKDGEKYIQKISFSVDEERVNFVTGTDIDKIQYDKQFKEDVTTVYSKFLSGEITLLDETQSEKWYIPNFQDAVLKYEYTYLDLDEDGVLELLVQLVDDPCGYNAVFHFEKGKIFCWNSDAVEMSCRDYPLQNGIMVRQYDYAGTRTYDLFRYNSKGEREIICSLFARDELIQEDSSEQFPYYSINGNEIDKSEFDKQLNLLVIDKMLDSTVWIEN